MRVIALLGRTVATALVYSILLRSVVCGLKFNAGPALHLERQPHGGGRTVLQAPVTSAAGGVAPTPSKLRIHVEYQIASLTADQSSELAASMDAALGVLQKYYQVNYPTADRLLIQPLCGDELNNMDGLTPAKATAMFDISTCGITPDFSDSNVPPDVNACGPHAQINPAHVAAHRNFPGGAGEPCEYYLYVTTLHDDALCTGNGTQLGVNGRGTIAYAGPCGFNYNPTTGVMRPVAGFVNICPEALLPDLSSDSRTEVLVHELHHALGFLPDLWEMYGDGKGGFRSDIMVKLANNTAPTAATAGAGGAVSTTPATEAQLNPGGGGASQRAASQTSAIVAPEVVQQARTYFGCPTLDHILLEDEGGLGTAGQHWELSLFQGDIMLGNTPFAADGSPGRLSVFTLLLMQASGWYTANLSAAYPLQWGAGAGCDFAVGCQHYLQSTTKPQYFCTSPRSTNTGVDAVLCNPNHDSQTICASDFSLANGCPLLVAADGGNMPTCKTPSSLLKLANLANGVGGSVGLDRSCAQLTVPATSSQDPGVVQESPWAVCFPASCDAQGTLSYNILGTKVNCPTGSILDLEQALSNVSMHGMSLDCHSAALICPTTTCPSDCNGRGQCINGTCICRVMYEGDDCSTAVSASGNHILPPALVMPGPNGQPQSFEGTATGGSSSNAAGGVFRAVGTWGVWLLAGAAVAVAA